MTVANMLIHKENLRGLNGSFVQINEEDAKEWAHHDNTPEEAPDDSLEGIEEKAESDIEETKETEVPIEETKDPKDMTKAEKKLKKRSDSIKKK